MPENMIFRTALHGYNREDVVAYIDKLNREHQEALLRLQERSDQLKAELTAANEALVNAADHAEAEQELAEAKAQIEELRTRCAQQEDQIDSLREQLEQLEEAGNVQPETVPMPITQDLDAPIPPVQDVLPAELKPSKDYTELELAAYRRAELAERMARERAGEVYRQIQSTFSQANAKLETGRSDLEQLTRTLNTDINDLLDLLTNLNATYSQAEAGFAEIGERSRVIPENED